MLDIHRSMASQPRSPAAPADDGANNGDFLPADELQEVFLRLPSKSLARLRTICRSWRSMLSDPLFVAAHATRSRADSIFVVAVHHPGHQLVDINLVDVSTGAVLRCMDGLALARRRFCVGGELLCFVEPTPGGGAGAVQVLDPATGATTDVLQPGDATDGGTMTDVLQPGGATAPQIHTGCTASLYLVGHVPTTGEHKVLHITDVRGKQACEVFTIGAAAGRNNIRQCQRWRPAQSPPMRVDSIPRRRAVVNGVAYFLPSNHNGRCLPDYDSVAAFDLEKEEWRPAPIRGPLSSERPGHCDQLLRFSLAELNGRLIMVHHNYQCKTIDMYSLSLTDTGEGVEWSRGPSLRLDSVLDRNRKGETLAQLLMELDDGRIVLFVPGTSVVRVYDPRKETRTDVMEMPRCGIVGCYKGSLLPFRVVGEAGCVCG
ncbi:hypothetical protein CFC21_095972 [Triticum aestivum]|uniref:F-box domain-containing protein n=3 Tax=Triticum TaxID=4564 RepID=A0A9R0Z4Z8_TRITD|nr:hypothetical protein CFC21_095972 [Triticum aestivum]VAI70102.1 unnamed protein product [Triticum turgidum subsp. durum]